MIIPKIGIIMVEQYHPADSVRFDSNYRMKKIRVETSYIKKDNKLLRRNAKQSENNGGKLSQLSYIRGDEVFT